MRRKMSRRQDRGLGLRQHIGIGRPSKLTPEVRETFLDAIRAGMHREAAAKFAGISPATLYRWLGDDRGPHRTFVLDVERAEAEVEQSAVTAVTSRVPQDPKLALAFLPSGSQAGGRLMARRRANRQRSRALCPARRCRRAHWIMACARNTSDSRRPIGGGGR